MKTESEWAARWVGPDVDELTDAQRRVMRFSLDRQPLAENTYALYEQRLSLGDKLADSMARIGGSWRFIFSFCVLLVVWAISNVLLGTRAFDPYPFVFLNLLLSMLAAIQAPIIMMAQNRQSEHDRVNAAHDYEINLKAEIEIMALHDKLDQLRDEQLVMLLQRVEELSEVVRRLERDRQA